MQHIPPLPGQRTQSALRFAPSLGGELEPLDPLAQRGERNQVPLTINTETISKINSLAPAVPAFVLDRQRMPGEKNIAVTKG